MKTIKPVSLLIALVLLTSICWQMGYAQTQPNIQLDSVMLYLLPEFNQPFVLVIHEITLDTSIPMPQELIFEVPPDAKIVNVINYTLGGRPAELSYQEAQIGNWKDLQITANTHRIRIEYQDPNLVRQGDQRTFEFQWLSLYPVTAFSVTVRQPLGVSPILSEPPLDELEDSDDDIQYYSADFGAIPAGELFNLTLEYTRATSDLGVPALSVQPAVPIDDSAPGRTPSPAMVVLWLLVASVAVTIIVGLYYWWFQVNVSDQSERFVQGVGIMNPEKQVYFCHECGMRAKLGDHFCSNCGSELRKPTPFDQPPND